ncbi:hypothetical protein X777_10637 [Ooceraea biroi]|uniref:Uncharacterized protein n=1 Tax=Ooceraea biroi TaxID=2015173 RepID=A0A026W5X9_OOCBI|nr:hypothetical protein X777_10637 [Ooceraea biroi]
MPKRRKSTGKESLDFKPSNIRIWIHNKDIGKLQQVLWEGHGCKLRCETSNHPRIRKFLEAVPCIMNSVKDLHATVINNDCDLCKEKLKKLSPIVLCGKDGNGLNVLHKAAGLGCMDIALEILKKCPATVLAQDNEGKTPLHYAAAVKDDGAMYNLLIEYGADESKLDNRGKAPAFYKNRPSDVDLSNLSVIPDAPRVSDNYPKNWDWKILEAGQGITRGMKKVSNSDSTDSAFSSAESTMKDLDGSSEIKNEEQEEEEEQETPAETPNGDDDEDEANDGDANTEDAEEETKPDDSEEKASSDDDVVTGPAAEKEEETALEERNETSTGDSGVDDPTQDEEQVLS